MKRKILFVIASVWVLISFLLVITTYAKYLSSIDNNTNVSIAVWNIVLNNQNIIKNDDFSQNVSLEFPGDTYRDANVIVPGSIGYFDLVIDTSEVTIPFQYSVTVEPDETNEIDDVEVIGYSLNGNNNSITYLDSTHTDISNTAVAGNATSSIRVYIQWNDTVANITNDIVDTELALSAAKAVVLVTVDFEQIMAPTPTPTSSVAPSNNVIP